MAYHELSDILVVHDKKRTEEAGDRTRDGTIDQDVAQKVMLWADSEVFSYLKQRYPSLKPSVMTPATIDAFVRFSAATLSAVRLFGRRNKNLLEKRATVIEALIEIREGRNSLGDHSAEDLVASVTDGRRREFREQGVLREYGEPFPGDETAGDNNDFLDNASVGGP